MKKFLLFLVLLLVAGCSEPSWYVDCKVVVRGWGGARYYVDESKPIVITEQSVRFFGALDMPGEGERSAPATLHVVFEKMVVFSAGCVAPHFEAKEK